MRLAKRIGAIVGIIVVLILAWIGLLSVTRGTPVRAVIAIGDRAGPPPVSDSLFTHTMELYTGSHIEKGNRVELLMNGDGTYPALWSDLRSAKQTITVQFYYCQPGAVADTFATVLAERAKAGVRVLVLLDAFGSQNLLNDDDWVRTLRGAGVELARLRPLHWYSLHKATFRSHVRVVVVDGRVGYTGGFGLADYWTGDGRRQDQWRESNARFSGPSVMRLQGMFAAAWAEATGELLTGDTYFPREAFADAGPVRAGLLFATPTTGSTNAERFMALSIASAKQRLWITTSYFVPDDDFRALLLAAARRGVDVRIITAGDQSDVKSTTYAGRARYEELLAGGVKIYEYLPTMVHAKTFVIDSRWLTVGSLNFDNRSLAFNNESNLVVLDETLGAQMDSIFVEDLRYSQQIELAAWRERGGWAKTKEWGANLLSRIL